MVGMDMVLNLCSKSRILKTIVSCLTQGFSGSCLVDMRVPIGLVEHGTFLTIRFTDC